MTNNKIYLPLNYLDKSGNIRVSDPANIYDETYIFYDEFVKIIEIITSRNLFNNKILIIKNSSNARSPFFHKLLTYFKDTENRTISSPITSSCSFHVLPTLNFSTHFDKENIIFTFLEQLKSIVFKLQEENTKMSVKQLQSILTKIVALQKRSLDPNNNDFFSIYLFEYKHYDSTIREGIEEVLEQISVCFNKEKTHFILPIENTNTNQQWSIENTLLLHKYLNIKKLFILICTNIEVIDLNFQPEHSYLKLQRKGKLKKHKIHSHNKTLYYLKHKVFLQNQIILLQTTLQRLIFRPITFKLEHLKHLSDKNLQEILFHLLWERTRLYFQATSPENIHPIIPKKENEIRNFFQFLVSLPAINFTEKTSYSKLHKIVEKNYMQITERILKSIKNIDINKQEQVELIFTHLIYIISHKLLYINKERISQLLQLEYQNRHHDIEHQLLWDIIHKHKREIERFIATQKNFNNLNNIAVNQILLITNSIISDFQKQQININA